MNLCGQLHPVLLPGLHPGHRPDRDRSAALILNSKDKNMVNIYALVLFATVGMMLMAASAHLIMLFLGLESCPSRFTSWRACFGRTPAPMRPL